METVMGMDARMGMGPSVPMEDPPEGFALAPVTPSEAAAALAVHRALRIDSSFVRWQEVPPIHGRGLAIHTPWARIAVGRTPGQAEAFVGDWLAGRAPRGLWLLASLEAAYPALPLGNEWTGTSLFLDKLARAKARGEIPALAAFGVWAAGKAGRAWPVTPRIGVVGSWRSWRDAVLLTEGRGGSNGGGTRVLLRGSSL